MRSVSRNCCNAVRTPGENEWRWSSVRSTDAETWRTGTKRAAQATSTAAVPRNLNSKGLPGCHHSSVNAKSPAAVTAIPPTTLQTSKPCSNGLSKAVKDSPEILASHEFPPAAAKSSTQDPSVQASASRAALEALSATAAANSEMAITLTPYRKWPSKRQSVSGAKM